MVARYQLVVDGGERAVDRHQHISRRQRTIER